MAVEERTARGAREDVFILTGMSRSGTSLSASLLQAGGAGMGQRQLMAHAGNAKGHFENIDFLDFHRAVLRQRGMPDAGWVRSGSLDVPAEHIAEARKIIEVNGAGAGPAGWGWKDPRTTLFLDFWNGLIPTAHFIFIYRTPWEVVDSIFRRGVSEDLYFRRRPEEAVQVWSHYKRCMLDFIRRHGEKTVLVPLDAVAANPELFIRLINERFGTALKEPQGNIVEKKLLHQQTETSPWAALVAQAFPETLELLEQLDAASSLRPAAVRREAIGRTTENHATMFRQWFKGHERARAAAKRKSRLKRWFGGFMRSPQNARSLPEPGG